MELMYKSTRGRNKPITASEAIIRGIADDGGLYIPVEIPKNDIPLKELMNFSYTQLASYILKKFLTDFSDEEVDECIKKAYSDNFDLEEIVKV